MNAICLFLIYSGIILSALLMVLCINPIHSVVFFIFVFFFSALLLTFLHADFIGLIFLMIYVGAIAVLFIFVVMMLNVKKIERDATTYLLIGGFFCLLFFMQLCYICMLSVTDNLNFNMLYSELLRLDYFANSDELLTTYFVQLVGLLLFYNYSVALIFSGLTLLIALIGAIYLTNTTIGYSVHSTDNSLSRNCKVFNIHIY